MINTDDSISWNSDLAYGVGLLVTDGNLSSDERHVIFTSKDIELIKYVRTIFKADNCSIGKTKNKHSEVFRIQIGNVKLYKKLIQIGLRVRKSLILEEINVPDDFFIDFLRGHLDGDGSITTYTDKYNTKLNIEYIYRRINVRFISASEKHAIWLHKNINEILGIKGRMHKTKPNHIGNSMFIVKFGKKESLILLKKIYYNQKQMCLSRKRKKYLDFIR